MNEAQWCDAGMYSGMTITMYISYAHVVQQYILLHFTKYSCVVNLISMAPAIGQRG